MNAVAQRPTQAQIKELLWAQQGLPHLRLKFPGVPFKALYDLVYSIEPRRITVADSYWLHIQEGMSMAEVAQEYNHSTETIAEALRQRGYEPVQGVVGDRYRLPKRLIRAWESLDRPTVYLRQLMEEWIDAINKGASFERCPAHPDDEPDYLSIDMHPDGWNALRLIACSSQTGWYGGGVSHPIQTKVLRTLLEELTQNMPELEAFRRDPCEFTGQIARNKLKEVPWRTSFSAPWYAYSLMGLRLQSRGASNRPNLSGHYRNALERLKKQRPTERRQVFSEIQPVRKVRVPRRFSSRYGKGDGKKWHFNRSISLSLLTSHKDIMAEAKEYSTADHQDLFTGLFFWSLDLDPKGLRGWAEWNDFIDLLKSDEEEAAKKLDFLAANGFASYH